MKKLIYNKVRLGMMLAATMFAGVACTDTWDDHYEATVGRHNGRSLWENISQDEQLAPFKRVLQATGYAAWMQAPQMLTVWAPTISDEEADQLIATYKAEKEDNVKDDENSVVVQFVKNHIALYNTSVSSYTEDSIKMLNGKYMFLTQDALNETPFLAKNEISTNGVLYKVGQRLPFYPNLWEKMQQQPELNRMTAFLKSYSKYELDEGASVPGGVVDGMTVYLDSVEYFTNTMFYNFGHINREDSSYIVLGLTDPVWESLYEQNRKYFTYSTDNAEKYRDSLTDVNANKAILAGLFFNKNLQKSPEDSLISTQYSSFVPGVDVFKDPFSSDDNDGDGYPGILSGLEKQQCSNGDLYVAPENRINMHLTSLFSPYWLEADYSSYYEVERDEKTGDKMAMSTCRTKNKVTAYDKEYEFHVGNNSYLEVKALNSANQTSILYTLPNTLSNVYYNVYAVMAPAIAHDEHALPEDTLPVKFRVKFTKTRLDGKSNEDRSWTRVPEGVNSANSTHFVTTPNKLDTICIARALAPLEVTGYGLQDGNFKMRLETNVGSTEDRTTYTKTMRIDRIIWVPYATKEEAEAERYK